MAHKPTQTAKPAIVQYEQVVEAIIALQALAEEAGREADKMPGLHLIIHHLGHGSLPRVKKLRDQYEAYLALEHSYPRPDPIKQAIEQASKSIWSAISAEMDQVLTSDHQALVAAETGLKEAEGQRDETVRESEALKEVNATLQAQNDAQLRVQTDLQKEMTHLQDTLAQQEKLVTAYQTQLSAEQANHHDTRQHLSAEISALEQQRLDQGNRHAEQLHQSEQQAQENKQLLQDQVALHQQRIDELTIEKNNAHTVATHLTSDHKSLTEANIALTARVAMLDSTLENTQEVLETEKSARLTAESTTQSQARLMEDITRLETDNAELKAQLKQQVALQQTLLSTLGKEGSKAT